MARKDFSCLVSCGKLTLALRPLCSLNPRVAIESSTHFEPERAACSAASTLWSFSQNVSAWSATDRFGQTAGNWAMSLPLWQNPRRFAPSIPRPQPCCQSANKTSFAAWAPDSLTAKSRRNWDLAIIRLRTTCSGFLRNWEFPAEWNLFSMRLPMISGTPTMSCGRRLRCNQAFLREGTDLNRPVHFQLLLPAAD